MKLSIRGLQNKETWAAAAVDLPRFDVEEMGQQTRKSPLWLHVGAGNIFRGFVATLQQHLLNEGLVGRGIIAAETFDYDIIDQIYTPFDNLVLNVTLMADASSRLEVIASLAEGIKLDSTNEVEMNRFQQIMTNPDLQMVSFTITEKGYALQGAQGALLPLVEQDIAAGPGAARHAMSLMAAGLFHRYQAGQRPIAMVSMDNCSHNGARLQESICTVAEAWREKGHVDAGFMDYLKDDKKVSFPWSMIDKITPRPAPEVQELLAKKRIEGMEVIVTSKNTFIAPFVNAERPQYLVIEDDFPNGRPPLEKAGVYMTDRQTVNDTERMKVTTCLNPLHTAMSMYGCLLGYTRICEEMKDPDILALIRRLGYVEGLPVVTDPGILSPKAFLDEVLMERLPNPFMPDTPQRIATDTSQKVAIRFGETIKSYVAQGLDMHTLRAIPLALTGWLRYLLGVDDEGNPMEVSPDPLLEELQKALKGIEWNQPNSYTGQLRSILANEGIFGMDLMALPLGATIEGMFREELAGPGAVRRTLQKYLRELSSM